MSFSEPNHSGHLGSKMSNFHLFSAESVQKALPMRAAKRRASGEPEAPSNKDIKGRCPKLAKSLKVKLL